MSSKIIGGRPTLDPIFKDPNGEVIQPKNLLAQGNQLLFDL
jgi:hypothetical protein